MSNNTIYVTSAERAALSSLSEALLEGWTLEDETGTAYEDEKSLRIRAGMARFKEFSALHKFVQDTVKTGTFDPSALKGIPENALPELCFMIGAVGVERIISSFVKEVKDDVGMQGLAGLTQIRRKLLQTNASIPRA